MSTKLSTAYKTIGEVVKILNNEEVDDEELVKTISQDDNKKDLIILTIIFLTF